MLGMMPIPEKSFLKKILGSDDGRVIFESIIDYLEKGRPGEKALGRQKPICFTSAASYRGIYSKL